MDTSIPFFDKPISDEYQHDILKTTAQEYKDFFDGLPEELQGMIRRILKVDFILMGESLEHGREGVIALQKSHIFSQCIIWACNNFKIDWPEKEAFFEKYAHLIQESYSVPARDSVLIEGIGGWNRFHLKNGLEDIHMRISTNSTLTAPGLTGDKEEEARKLLKEYGILPFPN